MDIAIGDGFIQTEDNKEFNLVYWDGTDDPEIYMTIDFCPFCKANVNPDVCPYFNPELKDECTKEDGIHCDGGLHFHHCKIYIREKEKLIEAKKIGNK